MNSISPSDKGDQPPTNSKMGVEDGILEKRSSADPQEQSSEEPQPSSVTISLPPIQGNRTKSAEIKLLPQNIDLNGFHYRPQSCHQSVSQMDGYQSTNLPGTIVDDVHVLTSQKLKGAGSFNPLYNNYPTTKKNNDLDQASKNVESQTFRDNKRPIDFILAFEDGSIKQEHHRKVFQKNLVEEGLELELEDKQDSESGNVYYLKIHTPWNLLIRYADILKLKKPIKGFIMIRGGQVWEKHEVKYTRKDIFSYMGMKNPFNYDENLIAPEPEVFSAGFNFHKEDMFLIKDRENFFTPSQRHLIVWEILKRVPYSSKDLGFGINRLLANKSYLAAYPLHDGPYDCDIKGEKQCDRRLLYLEWVRPRKFYKKQPLHLIRRYFGDKMALYFAWLGFYTTMLIPAAIMGVITFVGSLLLVSSTYNKPSFEICNATGTGNMTMCPQCDKVCNFWVLTDSCFTSKIAFLFDNPMTVVFAIGMSFWATMFLEIWKRKQVVLQWQWDMESYEDEEELRPQYEESVTTTKINPVTNKVEPYLPYWNKCSRGMAANSLVLLMLLLVIAAVLGVILYRLLVMAVMYKTQDTFIKQNAKLVTAGTAAFLNLLVIIVMNYFYEKLVHVLTDLEMPRTQTEYEDSFTLKMFLFQFINYYSSLIYIAFFKGRFFYSPGDSEARNNFILAVRYDMCDPAGCLFELCVQLAIIMVGKQFFNNCMEIILPNLKVWWNKRSNRDSKTRQVYTRWEQDYDLAEYDRLSLFSEYLEMVVQYGFVTLFVAAFPLAPLFALINNIVEIRLDAYKYLTKSRRPLPYRVQDIGIWFNILKAITYISVLTNALVISYTSDFIPRLVYWFAYSEAGLDGYIRNSLSRFNVSDFNDNSGPDKSIYDGDKWPQECFYRAYRTASSDEKPYSLTLQFYHVFTARLSFIIIFEHFIFTATGIISWAIPDVPVEVKNQIAMEKKVEKDALFESEMKKIREERQQLRQQQGTLSTDVDLGDGIKTPNTPTPSSTPKMPRNHSTLSLHDAESVVK